MEILKNIPHYLFAIAPGQEFSYYMIGLIIVGLMLVGSIVFKQYYSRKVKNGDYVFKKMFKKFPNNLVYFAIGLLFFLGIRYENIPYFAMRLWFVLLAIGCLAYFGRQLYKFLKVYPKELENFESRPRQNTENKYLPNKR